ncbi:MAG: PIN domain-containing protein [Phycisphaeraceae bacterium]|nr:PIN domain-containing protein [Phycisphaeraceae bacterium]
MIPRVVFDTNVLVSAIGWGGNPGRCVEAAFRGRIRALSCVEIMHELAGKLSDKLGFTDELVEASLASLTCFFEFVAIPGELKGVQTDPSDDQGDRVRRCRTRDAHRHWRPQASPADRAV